MSRFKTVRECAEEFIKQNKTKSNAEIAAMVRKEMDCKATAGCIAWYKCKMKEGKGSTVEECAIRLIKKYPDWSNSDLAAAVRDEMGSNTTKDCIAWYKCVTKGGVESEEIGAKLVGDGELAGAIEEMGIDLAALVARLAVFAPKDAVKATKKLKKNKNAAVYPEMRRAKSGESRDRPKGLDDNTYANKAIKEACGLRKKIAGYTTCHIYEKSCYEKEYYTALPNLVLLPSALASLTDHSDHIKACLRFRSYDLYGWYIGKRKPDEPENYPTNWLEPTTYEFDLDSLKQRKSKRGA